MTRKQFLDELEALLSDLPQAEREEALSYYEEYFDAADQDEQQVIQQLGSPARIAAAIKSNMTEGNETYAEYTETGYEDVREEQYRQMPRTYKRYRNNSILILAVIALVFLAPLIKGIVGGVGGVILTILLLPFLVAFALGVAAIGLTIAGAACVAAGIPLCFIPGETAIGILTMGLGFILAAVGILAFVLLVYLGSRLLPGLIRLVTDFLGRLVHRKDRARR